VKGSAMRALSITAAAHLAKWDGTVVPARDAATVVVVRPAGSTIEVLLLRRQASMAFAAGMHVFPGGAVHPGDHAPVPWLGPDADAWAQRWRCAPELAAALVVAAVRETFEETGILLAGPPGAAVLGAVDGADWRAARAALEAGELTLGRFLDERGLVLHADRLAAWAHWITPEFEPRRFDTRFFVAALPTAADGGRPDDDAAIRHGTEADSSFWIEPAAAVRAAERSEIAMMAPTLATLRDLCDLDPAAVLSGAAQRPITTVQPRLTVVDGQPRLTVEPDPAGS